MTRKMRKQAKKQRIAEAKGRDRLAKRINEAAKRIAAVITREENPEKDLFGRLCLCQTCQFFYCLCYDGTIQFCNDCFYLKGCKKLTEPQEPLLHRECKPCYWDRLDKEREVVNAETN